MHDFGCDVDVISAFTPRGALQMFTASKQNLKDLCFNMFFINLILNQEFT